jgi:predicted aspartyl protease
MIGFVDEELRAFVEIAFLIEGRDSSKSMMVWVDTAFNGGLVVSREKITELELMPASITEAILADGQLVQLQTFSCSIHWFGKVYRTQVIANDGNTHYWVPACSSDGDSVSIMSQKQ